MKGNCTKQEIIDFIKSSNNTEKTPSAKCIHYDYYIDTNVPFDCADIFGVRVNHTQIKDNLYFLAHEDRSDEMTSDCNFSYEELSESVLNEVLKQLR